MGRHDILSHIVLSLVSGLLGALVATIVTLRVEGVRETRRQKLAVITDLVANRNDLNGDAFSRALNGVLAAFPDSPDVLRAHEKLFAALSRNAGTDESNSRLIALWRAMAASASLKSDTISDAQFLRVMNPRS